MRNPFKRQKADKISDANLNVILGRLEHLESGIREQLNQLSRALVAHDTEIHHLANKVDKLNKLSNKRKDKK